MSLLLRQAFALFDTDNSGGIDAAEFQNLLAFCGVDASATMAQRYISQYDASGDQRLSFAEAEAFFKHSESVWAKVVADVKRAFAALDVDGSNTLDLAVEAKRVVAASELVGIADTDMLARLAQADADRDGELDLEEFARCVCSTGDRARPLLCSLLACAAGQLTQAVPDSSPATAFPVATPEQLAAATDVLRWVQATYGFEVAWEREEADTVAGVSFVGTACPPDLMVCFVPFLVHELRLYQPCAFNAAPVGPWVSRLVICGSLQRLKQPVGGLAVPSSRTLLLNAAAVFGSGSDMAVEPIRRWSQVTFRSVLQHELFHLMDWALASSAPPVAASAPAAPAPSDAEWRRLNPPGFQYDVDKRSGDYGSLSQYSLEAGSARPVPTFVSSYQRSALAEDKGCLFAFLFTDAAVVEDMCGTDAGLRAKVEALKAALAVFHPHLGAAEFWAHVHSVPWPDVITMPAVGELEGSVAAAAAGSGSGTGGEAGGGAPGGDGRGGVDVASPSPPPPPPPKDGTPAGGTAEDSAADAAGRGRSHSKQLSTACVLL